MAETNCAKWRRESVPVELRQKGFEAPVVFSCFFADLYFGCGISFVWRFRALALPLSRSALCLLAGSEPIAFAVHLQDVDVMGEPVEQCAGEPFRAKYRRPFIEWQIAGDDRGSTFIALTECLEEQFGADRCEWHIAQLIDDQQFDRVEMLL
jgi:hypothetical protein